MNVRHIITPALVLASLFCGSEALAQSYNNSYNRCKVNHKPGMWYENDYGHRRIQGTANPDNFDEGEGNTAEQRGMKVNPYNPNGKRIQKTHETIETIYINPEETKTITVPSTRLSDYSSMRYYQRWYNLSTDGNINTNWITPQGGTRFQMADGVYNGLFLGESTDQSDLCQVSVTGPSDFSSEPYILACDVSDYNDWDYEGRSLDNGEEFTEPTLSQRLIYVITNASVIKNAINKTTYYETHDIHFPAVRTSDNTPEQVSLNMSANNYYVSGENEGCGDLTATIDYNGWTDGSKYVYLVRTIPVIGSDGQGDGAWEWQTNDYGQREHVWVPNRNETGDALDNGQAQNSLNISGEYRKITFMMTSTEGDIPDGQVIYINVTKNGYKIAQFKITFDANTQAITQNVINSIGENDSRYERTNAYLDDEENGFTLLANLNFDFDNVKTYEESNSFTGVHFYPYPLGWDMSSYGFFTTKNSYKSPGANAGGVNKPYPEWGQYAITNGNGWQSGTGLLDNNSRYHLYVDANQYPGTICELPFNATFCRSSKLLVTAWVKSLDPSKADANILFILKGNRADGTSEVIHTQSTGQIHDTGSHPWYQIYFEFTSPDDYDFEKGYMLELFNNCAAATGADFAIDDIRVYLSPLQVNADISTPLCSTNSEAEVNVDINYELLLNRLGIEEQSSERNGQNYTGYYSFVNKTVFDRLIASGTDYHEAFAQAVVHGDGVYQGSSANYFGRITFSDYFNSNNGQNGMVGSEGRGSNRRITFKADVAANNAALDAACMSLSAMNGGREIVFEATDFPLVGNVADRQEAIDEYISSDASIIAAENAAEAARKEVSINRQGWIPRLEVGYRRNTAIRDAEHGFLVGCSIPIFSNHKKVAQARAQSTSAQSNLNYARLQAETEVRSILNEMEQTESAVSAYNEPLMRETLQLLRQAVEGGEISLIDYFVEASGIYSGLTACITLQNSWQKLAARLYKNRL